jgi:glycosyltransferase involved in cell wall biosynthesis
VPSTHNRDAFRTTLPAHIPIHVVPHIKRHRDTDVSTQARTQLMTSLKLERCRCVFYTVNTWTPRKNIDLLVEQFALAFREQHHLPDAPVLLIKTSETGSGKAPYYSDTYTRDLLNQAITAAAKKFSLTHAPQIRLLADNKLSGNALDILRSLAHIYVSLSSGEGFGMEAAEAAGRGVPVLMCAWSGPVDFMGQAWAQALGQPDSQGDWQLPPNWSGALAYRLVPCGVWPPMSPSYWPSQKMAEPEQAAVQAGLRYAAEHLNTLRARATLIAETYANTHCSARIAQQMLSLLAPHLTVATHG